MTALIDKPHLAENDTFYAALLAAHKGLSESQSQALNAQLILILANHIGKIEPLLQALELARKDIG